MIYSSLRFDNAMHVVPDMKDEGLHGIVWLTKLERQKRGTRFAAAKVSMSGEGWMEDSWSAATFMRNDRDFFMKEPRKKFAVKLPRDFLIHGIVP